MKNKAQGPAFSKMLHLRYNGMRFIFASLVLISLTGFTRAPRSVASDTIPLRSFRETYTHLDDSAFSEKLQSALAKGPLMFFRSFVNTYYSELASSDLPQVMPSICFGDAHLENFGFISFHGETRFVFNDLDDSGPCLLPADILRYFISLELAFPKKQALINNLIEEYFQVLKGKKTATQLDSDLFPDLNQKKKSILGKHTKNNKFKYSESLVALSPNLKKELLTEIKAVAHLKSLEILDLAESIKESGGSAGLKRYWLLVRSSQGEEVLEFKQLSEPGTSYGPWPSSSETPEQRMESTKNALWENSPQYYHALSLLGSAYLLRSRTQESLDYEKLSSSQLLAYLQTQVGVIASHHKKSLKMEIPHFQEWLKKNLPLFKNRYLDTYKKLKND